MSEKCHFCSNAPNAVVCMTRVDGRKIVLRVYHLCKEHVEMFDQIFDEG